MARSNIEGAALWDNLLMQGNRFGSLSQTLGGNLTLSGKSPHLLFLDPGGAGRNVLLPASPKIGDFYIIVNTADAAEVLTIQTSAGGALTPPLTPTQNETAVVFYSGATLGWRGFVAIGV